MRHKLKRKMIQPRQTLLLRLRTDAGQVQKEPRLQPKKYRRVSRRSRKQSLEDLRYEISEKLDDLDALEDSDFLSDR